MLLVELPLEPAVVGKQARDIGMASELVRLARSDQRVDRPAREQCSERLGASVSLDLNGAQQRRRVRPAVGAGFAHGALHPSDGCEIHIELMHEMTARPDRRGLGVERQPDTLAFEILRRADGAPAIDEDVAVSKHARGKHRQRDEWTIAAAH
jgi:hypothetical protein